MRSLTIALTHVSIGTFCEINECFQLIQSLYSLTAVFRMQSYLFCQILAGNNIAWKLPESFLENVGCT